MTSETLIPGTTVLIGLKSPRMFDGASGFGSQISMWLGPPWRKIRSTDLALPQPGLPLLSATGFAFACRRSTSARLRPKRPAPPTRKNSRRENPSQVLPGRPGIEIIFSLSVEQKRRTVDQGPGEILRDLQPRTLGEIDGRDLFVCGQTVQARQINFFHELLVVLLAFNQLRHFAVRLVDRIAHGYAVDHVQGVRKRDVR